MKQIDVTGIRSWITIPKVKVEGPKAIGTVCTFCSEQVVFTTQGHYFDQPRSVVSCTGSCPSCKNLTHFWVTELKIDRPRDSSMQLYMRPVPDVFLDVTTFDTDVPEPLRRAFTSAVDACNSGNNTATAVLCRRTLEVIFTHLLPEDKRNLGLADSILEVEKHADMSEPLGKLAVAIKSDSKLGALFELEQEPDHATSRSMVKLLEYLVLYLYLLPGDILKLEQILSSGESGVADSGD